MSYEQAPQPIRRRTLVLERPPAMPEEVPLGMPTPCHIHVRSYRPWHTGRPRSRRAFRCPR